MTHAEYPCPCCGYLVFDDGPGCDEICPICFWEDDLSQLRFPMMPGANHVSLIEAQQNYARDGVCEMRLQVHVRALQASDLRDPEWRPINAHTDHIERPVEGVDYGNSYPQDRARLYYWRQNDSRG